VVVSAVALSEKVPDPSLRPHSFTLRVGELLDLDECAAELVRAGYERTDQVEERGQFALRGGLLDVFPATEDRAVRVDMFDVEIESLRWFSTFTQRSLGEVEEVEIAPAAELSAEHRELAEIAAATGAFGPGDRDGERPDIAELLPVERFGALLDLVGEHAELLVAAEEELAPALSDHWTDVCAAFGDEDAHHLYVSPESIQATLAERTRIWLSAHAGGQEIELRAQSADTAARTLAEAEPELEKLVRSGYRTVVAFPRRGEGERAAFNLGRLKATWLAEDVDVGRQVLEPSRRRPCARDSSRPRSNSPCSRSTGCCAAAARSGPTRARARAAAARPGRAGGRCARSPSCGPVTSSCTRTTGSRDSRASRPARWPTSPATTCTWNTRAMTACSCPPTSSPRSRATSAPAGWTATRR
jgi:transcription-repair coupling factor (superfamily II helicase)